MWRQQYKKPDETIYEEQSFPIYIFILQSPRLCPVYTCALPDSMQIARFRGEKSHIKTGWQIEVIFARRFLMKVSRHLSPFVHIYILDWELQQQQQQQQNANAGKNGQTNTRSYYKFYRANKPWKHNISSFASPYMHFGSEPNIISVYLLLLFKILCTYSNLNIMFYCIVTGRFTWHVIKYTM